MRILVTGRGSSGSWKVRGLQLGGAIGATVKPNSTLADCKAADVIIVVKRISEETLKAVRKSKTRWFYDVVDFYPQPTCTDWSKSRAVHWVKTQIRTKNPTGIIWPNQRMMHDCGNGIEGMVLPHHHRPGIKLNPIREAVKTIGYEGSEKYLGVWRSILEEQCRRRGWRFVINPENLADLDAVVAFRDKQFDGYAQRHWKSAVKLSNAHGSGTPFIGSRENGYLENATGRELWADDDRELIAALDQLDDLKWRQETSRVFADSAITINRVRDDLMGFIQ